MKVFNDIVSNCRRAIDMVQRCFALGRAGRGVAALVGSGLIAALSACDGMPEELEAVQQGQEAAASMTYRMELKIGFDEVTSRTSRAEEPVLPTTIGTDFERTIKTLTLFVYDTTTGNYITHATLNPTDYTILPFTATSEEHYLYITKEFTLVAHGNYTVYAAANLSTAQINEFKLEIDQVMASASRTQYYELTGNHLNIAANITSATYGMAMSCTAPASFEFTPSKTGGICVFHMKRIAAKALVIAKTTDSTNKYVVVETSGSGEQKFMVLLDDVSFTINTVNTRTFLYQQTSTAEPYVIDPNDMAAGADDWFVYNPITSWSNFLSYFKDVKPYNSSLYPYDRNTDYASSIIYFPENTFNVPADMTGIDPEKQATHFIIRAKITPLTLMVKKGLKDFAAGEAATELYNLIATAEDAAVAADPTAEIYSIHCTNPDYSPLICELSLKYENFLGAVTNTTFFVKEDDANKDLYTYSAAKYVAQGTGYVYQAGNTLKLDGFQVYNDGYANYKVYISDPQTRLDEDVDNKWKRSQVFRNTYYILCIDKFIGPGNGLDPDEDYIQVHTEVVPYINSWKGVINIDDETTTAE